jgi:chorismate mutase
LNTSKILIAGPCAAESRAQLFATAKEINDLQINNLDCFDLRFFRCGIWKARTNPNDFQGIGDDAFGWLKEIKETFGLKICVEVASAEHVKRCIENNIDAVWIGARTAVNPFLVQEIADVLQRLSLTVLVKNPVNPDLNLWIGAIQRFKNAGIENVLAIHRGFSIDNENVYRNAPCWEIPIALKMKLPDTLMLCDISHIAGNLSLQQNVAQTALNYGFNGLMTEVHHAPEKALSDSKQQLLPSQFLQLLKTLTLNPSHNPADDALFIQRNLIKNIDIQISKLLSKRMEAVDEIAAIKSKYVLPALQPDQWKKVVAIYEENALTDKNYQQFLDDFLLLLHKSSLKRQE